MAKATTKKSKAPTKSTRPRARPTSAPRTSQRPRGRPVDLTPDAEKGDQQHIRSKSAKKKMAGGKMGTKKYAKGGMARGCGAATKGKKYSRAG